MKPSRPSHLSELMVTLRTTSFSLSAHSSVDCGHARQGTTRDSSSTLSTVRSAAAAAEGERCGSGGGGSHLDVARDVVARRHHAAHHHLRTPPSATTTTHRQAPPPQRTMSRRPRGQRAEVRGRTSTARAHKNATPTPRTSSMARFMPRRSSTRHEVMGSGWRSSMPCRNVSLKPGDTTTITSPAVSRPVRPARPAIWRYLHRTRQARRSRAPRVRNHGPPSARAAQAKEDDATERAPAAGNLSSESSLR